VKNVFTSSFWEIERFHASHGANDEGTAGKIETNDKVTVAEGKATAATATAVATATAAARVGCSALACP